MFLLSNNRLFQKLFSTRKTKQLNTHKNIYKHIRILLYVCVKVNVYLTMLGSVKVFTCSCLPVLGTEILMRREITTHMTRFPDCTSNILAVLSPDTVKICLSSGLNVSWCQTYKPV